MDYSWLFYRILVLATIKILLTIEGESKKIKNAYLKMIQEDYYNRKKPPFKGGFLSQ